MAKMTAYQYNGSEINKVKINIDKIRSNDVLIKIDKVTVCGTDHHIFENNQWAKKAVSPGIIIGHEGCGTIIETGSKVKDFTTGDYVALESHFACPDCEKQGRNSDNCNHYGIIGIHGSKNKRNNHQINGVFSEYIAIPSYCCYKISDEIRKDLYSASLMESAGNTWEIIRYIKNSNIKAKSIAIFGCGPHGLNLQLFAKQLGIPLIIAFETDENRIEFAKHFAQANQIFNPKEISYQDIINKTNGGFDITVDMVGNIDVINISKDISKNQGYVILFGLAKKEAIIANNRNFNEIIFNNEIHKINHKNKNLFIKGFTGRSSESWKELIIELKNSKTFRKKLSHPLEIIGNLHDIESFIKGKPSNYLKVGFQIS